MTTDEGKAEKSWESRKRIDRESAAVAAAAAAAAAILIVRSALPLLTTHRK